jgi:hypothetical protein
MVATQYDGTVRTVAIANLEAICERLSGTCHRFAVESVGKHTVKVSYSNPNEYGSEYPIYASFPCWQDFDTTVVALSILRVSKAPGWHGEEWQAFVPLTMDAPKLWRNPETNEWQTADEIKLGDTPFVSSRHLEAIANERIYAKQTADGFAIGTVAQSSY